MNYFETLINVPAIFHDDITFCQEECEWNDCMRNKKNIRDKTIPHSFSVEIPEDCPKKHMEKTTMMKNFVIIKHLQDSGKFLFRVPKDVILDAGDQIVCDTVRGKDQLGVCCCNSFFADPEVVCKLFGIYPASLRFVTGRVACTRFDLSNEEDDNAESRENG